MISRGCFGVMGARMQGGEKTKKFHPAEGIEVHGMKGQDRGRTEGMADCDRGRKIKFPCEYCCVYSKA